MGPIFFSAAGFGVQGSVRVQCSSVCKAFMRLLEFWGFGHEDDDDDDDVDADVVAVVWGGAAAVEDAGVDVDAAAAVAQTSS